MANNLQVSTSSDLRSGTVQSFDDDVLNSELTKNIDGATGLYVKSRKKSSRVGTYEKRCETKTSGNGIMHVPKNKEASRRYSLRRRTGVDSIKIPPEKNNQHVTGSKVKVRNNTHVTEKKGEASNVYDLRSKKDSPVSRPEKNKLMIKNTTKIPGDSNVKNRKHVEISKGHCKSSRAVSTRIRSRGKSLGNCTITNSDNRRGNAKVMKKNKESNERDLKNKKITGRVKQEMVPKNKGSLDCKSFEFQATSRNNGSFRYIGRISLKCPEDTHFAGSWIMGLVVTTDNRMVATDINNNAIKMVDIEKDHVMSRLRTKSSPRGITMTNDRQIAVTIPDKFRIIILGITEHCLELQQRLVTQEKCFAIVYHAETLIVSCINPRRIQTLNMRGVVLRSFDTFEHGQYIVSVPCLIAISTDKQSVYTSDLMVASVRRYSLDGRVLNEFSSPSVVGASGIAVDRSGAVYLGATAPDLGRATCVYKFNANLTNPKVILDGKVGDLFPHQVSMYLNKETDILFVYQSYCFAAEYVSMYYIGSDNE